MSKRKLRRELSEFSRKSETVATLYSGSLGIYIGGTQYVDVPNRPGFVYVRLRNNISELIQAHNEVVSPVYGLPVLLIRNKTYYEIYGRDTVQYASYWDSNSSYLPKHGHQHEFDPDNNGGGDLVFVHGEQFYPMMTFPSGSDGSNTVLIAPYRYFYRSQWYYTGNTGVGDLLQYGPTGANNAKLLLVGTTSATGNPFVKLGSEFSEGITGAAALTQFVPTNITPIDEIPGAIIRLVTGTQTITWANIYDARQYMGILQAGSGTGGGVTDFLGLSDTPNSYAGQADKLVVVNAAENALEFRTNTGSFGGGGGGGSLGIYGQDEAVGLGTGTTLNVVGNDISLSISGTVLTLLHSDPTGTPHSFLDLTDTPDSYSGQNSKFVAVNVGGTALEFVSSSPPGGGGSSGLVVYDDSIYKVTGTAISFDGNLSVVVTGSVAFVSANSLGFGNVYIASQNGAILDTNLVSGGGTDDTAAIQAILNSATGTSSTLLIMDGPALVSGLDIYSNTTIYCLDGAGFYLKNGSNREILRNAHRSRGTITEEHISIIGGYYNGNHSNQTGAGSTGHQQSDETFMNGINMFGINYLNIENVIVVNTMAFGINVANGTYLTVNNYEFDRGSSPHANQDGFHFNGPWTFAQLTNLKIRSYDDAIAINAGDDSAIDLTIGNQHGPYIGQGVIVDVIIDGLELIDVVSGIRLLTHNSSSRLDRITIKNVYGTYKNQFLLCSTLATGLGSLGQVLFENINVTENATIAINDSDYCFAKIADIQHVESIEFHNIHVHSPIDTRPIFWIKSSTIIDYFLVDGLSIYDSNVAALGLIPIKLDGYVSWLAADNIHWIRPIGGTNATSVIQMTNAASHADVINVHSIFTNDVDSVVYQTAGDTIVWLQATHIQQYASLAASFIVTGTVTKINISNWLGSSVLSGSATATTGDAFLTAGLNDPGSNGIVKRTALNTTSIAAASDVTTLFSGVGDYLKSDGTRGTPTTAGKYRQFVWADDGAGSWVFVSVSGSPSYEPILNLMNLE